MCPPTDDGSLGDGQATPSEFTPAEMDDLFDVLADPQRRCALQALSDAGGEASFDELVSDVARRTGTSGFDDGDRREIATALYHVHLPKLHGLGLVADYDTEGSVALADRIAQVPAPLFEEFQ